MTLIDQRILIDAPQEIVWDFVANPDNVARWHAGYTSVSVLTTQYMEVGTRRRCALTGGGKDVIEEITAAVNGIGYEYIIIEGSSFRAFLARIRLQAGPDGTSVQWTIDYTPKGLIGVIKNRLGGKKQLTAMMAASLRQLRHQVDAHGVRMDQEYRERVGMRERLDFNERAQYQRRYAPPPGIDPVDAPEQPEEAIEQPAFVEATESVDSVQPVEPAPTALAPDTAPDVIPSFVTELIQDEGEADYSHKADTKPRPPEGLRDAIAEQEAAQQITTQQVASQQDPVDIPEPPIVEPPPPIYIEPPAPVHHQAAPARMKPERSPLSPAIEPKEATPPSGIPIVAQAQSAPEDAATTSSIEPDLDHDRMSSREKPTGSRAVGEYAPVERAPNLPPQTPITDTGEISIWEVFGVNRPSDEDTQTLEELVQTVREREQTARARRIMEHTYVRAGTARPTRLKVRMRAQEIGRAIGLRLHLALQAAGVRLRKPFG